MAVMTCFTAKHNGRRGGLVNRFVVSDTTRTRILALHESGHSYREICRTIRAEGHFELNRGRKVREHNIRAILLAYMKDKRKKSGSDTKPKPQTVERFVQLHCERGDATDATCRVFARPLYLAYVQHCHTANDATLSRVEFSKAFQSVTGLTRSRHSTKRDFYAGIRLPPAHAPQSLTRLRLDGFALTQRHNSKLSNRTETHSVRFFCFLECRLAVQAARASLEPSNRSKSTDVLQAFTDLTDRVRAIL